MKSKSLYILSQNKAKTPICQVCRNIDATGILCFKVEDDKLQLSQILWIYTSYNEVHKNKTFYRKKGERG